jgi:fatty acid desaturase
MSVTGTTLDTPRAGARSRPSTDYSRLLRTVQEADLFKRRYLYYAVKITALVALLGGIWVAFAFIGQHWSQVAVAAALGIVFTQILFLSHDAAHRQIFESNRKNEMVALFAGTLLGGVSLAWWNNKHNRHHAGPNQIDKDPDIDPSIVHFYPLPAVPKNRVLAWLHARQGWWFFPLLVVEALNLHYQSVEALIRDKTMKRRGVELSLLAVRLLGYPAVLFVFLSPGLAATFLAVQLGLTGVYLGSVFSASHIGMPIVPRDRKIDFLRRQVLMSRNVKGGRTASLAMGGLNYQIEHHLFPHMPRPSLRRVRPMVAEFCREAEITYNEVTIFRAWAIVAQYLNRVGLAAGRDPFVCPVVATLRPL